MTKWLCQQLKIIVIIQYLHSAKTQYRKLGKNIPRKELRSLSPNFHINVSVSDGLPNLVQKNMWTTLEIYKSLTDT